jgi:hypothetical protein
MIPNRAARAMVESEESAMDDHWEFSHVHLPSLARVAAIAWAGCGALAMFTMTMAWLFVEGTGRVAQVEGFVTDLTGLEHFEIQSGSILATLGLLVFVAVIVATALTVFVAACYNAVTTVVGGVEVTLGDSNTHWSRARSTCTSAASPSASTTTT